MKASEVASSTGLLAEFNRAGVLGAADVHVAQRLGVLAGEGDEQILLACALAVRALRSGSVCVELATVAGTGFDQAEEAVETEQLPWPEPEAWQAAVEASPLVTQGPEPSGIRPLRMVGGKLYLERYWGHEEDVRVQLVTRRLHPPAYDEDALTAALVAHFADPGLPEGVPDRQREAAETAARNAVTVVAGGPGTGKTTTVARILTVLLEQPGPTPRVALAAPTGKAAARLEESLGSQLPSLPEAVRTALSDVGAQTVHKLLGWRADNHTRFRHDAVNPLPHDVVVVDEASMMSVHLVDRLLEALRPEARLVLVGDPDQLASVEAGAVLADVVHAQGDRTGVVVLEHNWRYGSAIGDLAGAIRAGDADATLAALGNGGDAVEFMAVDLLTQPDLTSVRRRIVAQQRDVLAAAQTGDALGALAALERHRLLCGHNTGPFGVGPWQWQIERWLAEDVPGLLTAGDDYHVGRPLLLGTNMPDVDLANGDTGVVVAAPDGPRAAFSRGGQVTLFSPAQLVDVATLHAMTVHKSQGSQYDHVTVVLPPVGSPLLRRELLYTAVTRAKSRVTLIGTPEAVREAVGTPARRATGLRERL